MSKANEVIRLNIRRIDNKVTDIWGIVGETYLCVIEIFPMVKLDHLWNGPPASQSFDGDILAGN